MKKKLLSLLLAAAMMFSMIPATFAASDEAIDAAYALNGLGLFNGVGTNADGTPNFDLDRAPTRHEAVTMLVRLLGKDADAKAGSWTTPFTDVDDWAKPYVGYAYANGLTSGTSATTFGGTAVISASQYLTFVLRALGYTSGTDFQWDKAWELSDQIGLTDKRYHAGNTQFTRGDIAIISESALNTKDKNSGKTLLEQLVKSSAVDQSAAELYLSHPVRVKSITLNQSSLTLNKGDSVELVAFVFPENATDKNVVWSSSDPQIVSVSSKGRITAKEFGSVKITATASNGLFAVCDVTVKPVEVTSITLNKSNVSLATGKSVTLKATIAPSNADDQTVTWSSSNSSVASVVNGKITGIKEGSAVITATAGSHQAVCNVSVTQAPIEFSGSGDKVITNITLPRGAYFVEYTHNGRSNFIVDLYHGADGSDWDLVANDLGNCSGRKVISDALDGAIQNGMLEVNADGSWTISIKKVSNTTTSTNLKGSGDWVTSGSFVATQKRYVCTYSGTNKSNFIVEVYSFDGDWNLAANDIAPCSGSKIITLDIGTRYFISVESDGDWTVDLGIGDSLETISPSDISDVGTSGSDSSSGNDFSGTIVYYDDYYGVPDFGAILGVKTASNMTSGNGYYFYKSSDVYAAAGRNALAKYIDILKDDCGFNGVVGYSGDSVTAQIYKNKSLGLTVRISVTMISSGEYICIEID